MGKRFLVLVLLYFRFGNFATFLFDSRHQRTVVLYLVMFPGEEQVLRNLERCAKVNNTSSRARGYRLFCLCQSRKGFQGISTSVRVLYRYIRRYRASKALSECATLLTTPAALRNRRSDKMKRSSSRGIDSESNGKAYNRFCNVCETIATVIVHNSGSRGSPGSFTVVSQSIMLASLPHGGFAFHYCT